MSDRIAVIIPAWNLGEELSEAVASVRDQSVPARVIVVDNASDRSLPDMGDVELVRLPWRASVGAARNAGLALVDEEFVMFMEGDDVLLPGALSFLFNELRDQPRCSLVAGSFVIWNPHTGERARARWPFDYCYRLNRRRRLFALVNCVRNLLPTTGPVLIRTAAARAAGGFADANWAEDWVFGAVLAFVGTAKLSRRVCALYRVDAGRVTLSDRKELRFGPAWRGRRGVRRRLRSSAIVPWPVRLLSPVLAIPHLYFTLQDLRLPRQRLE